MCLLADFIAARDKVFEFATIVPRDFPVYNPCTKVTRFVTKVTCFVTQGPRDPEVFPLCAECPDWFFETKI